MTPEISVVMAVYGEQEALFASLDSILGQQGVELECLLVADGPQAPATWAQLEQRAGADPRLRLVQRPHGGLTRALIQGCQLARGKALARIDVGDRMEPGRLSRQWRVLQDHADCVLVTSDVAVYGPAWEPLLAKRCPEPMVAPAWVNTIAPDWGLEFDIPHHGSVMLRRSAYLAAGGYRREFYYGQDWDLWYRLAPLGTFFHCPQVLYSTRLFVGGISSRRWREQQQIARLSLACYAARSRGESEAPWIGAAALIRPAVAYAKTPTSGWLRVARWDQRAGEGAYFIGECLRRRGDRRCMGYFLEAIRSAPWLAKAWLRLVQATPLLVAKPPSLSPGPVSPGQDCRLDAADLPTAYP
jgi:glycosyltransferase involved in cell wall biosynthesis